MQTMSTIEREPYTVYKVKKSSKMQIDQEKSTETQKYRAQKERTFGSKDRIRAA